MYFINEEIKPRLPELKQFTPYCPPKIASMPRHQAGHVWPGHGMAGCQLPGRTGQAVRQRRLPGRAWLASQASQLAGRKRVVMCIVELQVRMVVGWAVSYEFW